MPYRFTARSASQAGPLKSGKAARGVGDVQPSSRSAIPGRSALGGPGRNPRHRRGTHFTIERARRAGPETIETDVLFAPCRKRPFPVWGWFGHGHVPVERLRVATERRQGSGVSRSACFQSWVRETHLALVAQYRAQPHLVVTVTAQRGAVWLARGAQVPPPTPPPYPALCAADAPDLSGGERGQVRACMGTAPCRAQ